MFIKFFVIKYFILNWQKGCFHSLRQKSINEYSISIPESFFFLLKCRKTAFQKATKCYSVNCYLLWCLKNFMRCKDAKSWNNWKPVKHIRYPFVCRLSVKDNWIIYLKEKEKLQSRIEKRIQKNVYNTNHFK